MPLRRTRPVFKRGLRPDIGVSVRSGWEANCLRWFNYKEVAWKYEPETFYFEQIKRGTRTYTPDIWLPHYIHPTTGDQGVWVEIKGALTPQSRTKLKRFKKYFPAEFAKLTCIVLNPAHPSARFFQELEVPVLAYYQEIESKFREILPDWGS